MVPVSQPRACAAGLADCTAGSQATPACLSLCWAVLDLFIASARGLGRTALEHRQLWQMRAPHGPDTGVADRIRCR